MIGVYVRPGSLKVGVGGQLSISPGAGVGAGVIRFLLLGRPKSLCFNWRQAPTSRVCDRPAFIQCIDSQGAENEAAMQQEVHGERCPAQRGRSLREKRWKEE